MAFCPQCSREISATAPVCPHCGYDFPAETSPARTGFAYSGWADMALLVGTAAAGLGCVFAVIFAVFSLIQGNLLSALVVGPLAFFLQLAQLVVFVRVQHL